VIKNISVKDVAGDDTYDDRIDARLVFHTSSTELSFEDLVRMGGQSGNAAEYAHFIMSAMLMLLSCIVQYTKDSKSFTIFVDNFDSFVFPQKSTRPSFLGTLAYFLNGTKSQVVSVVPSNEYLNMLITTNRPVVKLCVDNKGSGLTGIHAYSSES
jgi:hypothetical protein